MMSYSPTDALQTRNLRKSYNHPNSNKVALANVIATFVIFLLVSPFIYSIIVPVKAALVNGGEINTNKVDTSNYHGTPHISPSTGYSSNNNDFRSQAVLSGVVARQTNNIVNTNAYYDIIFNTATTAAIKEIRVTFPAGTDVSIARLVEAEGIGKGVVGPPTISGQTVRYIVINAEVTTIPAGTQIRLELANIVNPPNAGNGYSVTVETRGTSNNIIDGPTQSFAYSIKQIGSSDIASNAVTSEKISPMFMTSRLLLDDAKGASFGWIPDGSETVFYITDESAILGSNPVLQNVGDNGANSQCEATGALNGFFVIQCNSPPPQGSELRYTIANLPLK